MQFTHSWSFPDTSVYRRTTSVRQHCLNFHPITDLNSISRTSVLAAFPSICEIYISVVAYRILRPRFAYLFGAVNHEVGLSGGPLLACTSYKRSRIILQLLQVVHFREHCEIYGSRLTAAQCSHIAPRLALYVQTIPGNILHLQIIF